MNKKKGWKNMTPERFVYIKSLLTAIPEGKGRIKAIVQITETGYETIKRVEKCDTFEKYKAEVKRIFQKYHPKKAGFEVEVKPETKPVMMTTEVQLLSDIRDILIATQKVLIAIQNEKVDETGNRPFKKFFGGR